MRSASWWFLAVIAGCARLERTPTMGLSAASATAGASTSMRADDGPTWTVFARAEARQNERGALELHAETWVERALAAHGRWENTSLGRVWLPAVGEREAFVPYVTHGRWEERDDGPRWVSVFSWGELVFHRGAWVELGDHRWAWRWGAVFDPSPVRWRWADGFVGWSVHGVEAWCWVPLDALFSAAPSDRAVRGPEASAIAAASVEIPSARGMMTALRGARPPQRRREQQTAVVVDRERESAERSMREASEHPRRATVVIRDEAALARFELLQSYVTNSGLAVAVRPSVEPSLAERAVTVQSAPVAPPRPPPRLWADEERARPPVVASVSPRVEPWNLRLPSAPPAAPPNAPVEPPRPVQREAPSTPPPAPLPAPSIAGGGGFVPMGARPSTTAAPRPATTPARTVAAVRIPVTAGVGPALVTR